MNTLKIKGADEHTLQHIITKLIERHKKFSDDVFLELIECKINNELVEMLDNHLFIRLKKIKYCSFEELAPSFKDLEENIFTSGAIFKENHANAQNLKHLVLNRKTMTITIFKEMWESPLQLEELSFFNVELKGALEDFEECLINLPILVTVKTFNYAGEFEYLTAILKLIPNLEHLSLLDMELDQAQLQEIMNLAPLLKTSYLLSCNLKSNKEGDNLPVTQHNNIETLELNETNATLHALCGLVNLCNTNLKNFSVLNSKISTSLLPDKSLPLEKLNKISFSHSKISHLLLNYLWNAATSLESLAIKYCNMDIVPANDLDTHQTNKMPTLKTLRINDAKQNPHYLLKLLSLCQNLERLDLSMCRNLQEIFIQDNISQIDELSLKKLTFLDLPDTDVDRNTLAFISKIAPNIEHLGLEHCSNIIEQTSFSDKFSRSKKQPVLFKKLKKLHACETDLALYLEALIEENKKLKFITLQSNDYLDPHYQQIARKNIKAAEKGFTFHLPEIESLSLSGLRVTNETFSNALQCANLATLELSACEIKCLKNSDELTAALKDTKCDGLKNLAIMNMKVHPKNILLLLKHFTNLETLTLTTSEKMQQSIDKIVVFAKTTYPALRIIINKPSEASLHREKPGARMKRFKKRFGLTKKTELRANKSSIDDDDINVQPIKSDQDTDILVPCIVEQNMAIDQQLIDSIISAAKEFIRTANPKDIQTLFSTLILEDPSSSAFQYENSLSLAENVKVLLANKKTDNVKAIIQHVDTQEASENIANLILSIDWGFITHDFTSAVIELFLKSMPEIILYIKESILEDNESIKKSLVELNNKLTVINISAAVQQRFIDVVAVITEIIKHALTKLIDIANDPEKSLKQLETFDIVTLPLLMSFGVRISLLTKCIEKSDLISMDYYIKHTKQNMTTFNPSDDINKTKQDEADDEHRSISDDKLDMKSDDAFDLPDLNLTKDDMIEKAKNAGSFLDDFFSSKKTNDFTQHMKKNKPKLTKAPKIDYKKREKSKRDKKGNTLDIEVNPKSIKKGIGWIKENYSAMMDAIKKPLVWFRHNFGFLSINDVKDIIRAFDVEPIIEKFNASLHKADFRDMTTNSTVSRKMIRVLMAISPETIRLIKAILCDDKKMTKESIEDMLQIMTDLNLPKSTRTKMIKLITKVAQKISVALPKLFKLANNAEKLKTPFPLLRILKIPSSLPLFLSLKSLNKSIDKLPIFLDEDIEHEDEMVLKDISEEHTSHDESDVANLSNLEELSHDENITEVSTGEFVEDFLDEMLIEEKKRNTFSFRTWETLPTKHCKSFDLFWCEVTEELDKIQPKTPNALIHLPGDQIAAFNLEMMRHAEKFEYTHHYIHNLDDVHLKTMASLEGKASESKTELGEFCLHAKPGDVLLVNISKHRRGLNGITDTIDERQILTQTIPEGVRVIVLVDNSLGIQLDGDVYGRCSVRTTYHLQSSTKLDNVIMTQPLLGDNPVRLYHDTKGWRQKLVGTFTLEGEHISFVNERIADLIASGENEIHISNAPRDCAEFDLWLQTIMTKGKIYFNGQSHDLPKDFKIYMTEDKYDLSDENCSMTLFDEDKHLNFDHALNTVTLHNFFKNHFTKDKKFYEQPGWLSLKKSLRILVNSALTRDQWALVIDECKKHNVEVEFYLMDVANCPHEYVKHLENKPKYLKHNDISILPNENECNGGRVDVIVTNDIDNRVKQLAADENIIINAVYTLTINDTFADLIAYLDCIETGINYQVETKPGPVWKSLQQGQTIALAGPINTTLRAKLATLFGDIPRLWINGESQDLKGRLILVTDPEHDVTFAKNHYLDDLPIPQLNPPELINVDPDTDVQQKRYNAVNNLLAIKPWVRIMGEFGVGKSVFGRDEFKRISEAQDEPVPVEIFIGEDNIQAYGESQAKGRKVLILDEYNLKKEGYWDKFKGLLNPTTPGFIHNHVFYPTRPAEENGFNDLVFFMANPKNKNYEGRHHHQFIDNHVSGVQFNDFPDAFLIEKIITPIMHNAKLGDLIATHAENLCVIYNKIKSMARDDKTISARNLTMLTLRFAVYCMTLAPEEAMATAALEEVLYLLDDDHHFDEFFKWLDDSYHIAKPPSDKMDHEIETLKEIMLANNFTLTASRLPITRQLLSMLSIREATMANPTLEEHMLRGVLIEGETRIGKSALMKNILLAREFCDGLINDDVQLQNTFTHITAGNVKTMDEVLKTASEKGSVAIVDEINTGPFESQFIDVLTGVNNNGEKVSPGTRIWAAQNPVASYSERQPLSSALKSRFIKITMSPFPANELKDIIDNMGIEEYSEEMLHAYLRDLRHGKKHGYFPLPTPDDLFRKAKEVAKKLREEEGAEYFYDDFSASSEEDEGLQEDPMPGDALKEEILARQSTLLENKTTWKQFFRHPISTYRQWRANRKEKREISALKKTWYTQKTQGNIQNNEEIQMPQHDVDTIDPNILRRFSTSYLIKKFKKGNVSSTHSQTKLLSTSLKKEFAAKKSSKRSKDRLIQKTAKIHLWATMHEKIDAEPKLNENTRCNMHAFAQAKQEMLEAEVAVLTK